MTKITKKAYGKLNLSLDTIGKREDGYHLVRMLMQTVSLCDTIIIEKTETAGITLTTNKSDLPNDENNLIYKAAQMLIQEFDLKEGVRIHLEKNIPVAAGMAGGSADCAATFTGMNELFNLGLTQEQLMERGVKLGADIPYCILGGTALSEGIGEILTPVTDILPCKVLLVKPNIDVATKWVYSTLKWDQLNSHPDTDGMIESLHAHSLEGVASRLANVLETVTIPEYPIIQEIKDTMLAHGALNAMMSGSGPTVFGLYPDEEAGKRAYETCKKLFPDFQVEWTEFISREEILNN